MKILVVGAGSIGRRHTRNLRTLGVEHLAACDINQDSLETAVNELGVQTFSGYAAALETFAPDAVLICTPPIYHISQAMQALEAGAHLFIEKPLASTREGVPALIAAAERTGKVVQVGYNLRFHPGVRMLKQLVDEGTIGKVIWAQIEVGQYLPDWRPWQDYRQSYTAHAELGGGIILDATHEIDYTLWLLGTPCAVMCMAGQVSALEVDVEDCATLLVRFESGAQADIHLDFVQRSYARGCKLVGEEGSLIWHWGEPVRHYRAAADAWEDYMYNFETNQMYIDEVHSFLDCISCGKPPLVSLPQADAVLQVALAAKCAAEMKRMEVL